MRLSLVSSRKLYRLVFWEEFILFFITLIFQVPAPFAQNIKHSAPRLIDELLWAGQHESDNKYWIGDYENTRTDHGLRITKPTRSIRGWILEFLELTLAIFIRKMWFSQKVLKLFSWNFADLLKISVHIYWTQKIWKKCEYLQNFEVK